MPIFMVERNFAEELEPSFEVADGINRTTTRRAFAGCTRSCQRTKRKTYCLYEAPSPEAIRTAAARAGLPADVIVEVRDRIMPDGALSDI
ncbi:MAG TPA: nickel-binding protein [Mycobacterium sp.]|nr:nickel-binding protein [Mycobacterium sp.]